MFRDRLRILNLTDEQKELDLKKEQMGGEKFDKIWRFFKFVAVPKASGKELEINKAYLT